MNTIERIEITEQIADAHRDLEAAKEWNDTTEKWMFVTDYLGVYLDDGEDFCEQSVCKCEEQFIKCLNENGIEINE